MNRKILSLFLLLNIQSSLAVVEHEARKMAALDRINLMAKIVMMDAYARFIRKQRARYPPYFPLCGVILGGLLGHIQKKLQAKYHEIKYDPEFKNAGYNKPMVLVKRTFPILSNKKKLAF
jgi:hypothetical protein